MNKRTKAFIVGIFVIVAFVIAAWFMLFLRPMLGDGKKILHVRFPNIERITVGTRVTFAGKPVGEVIKINELFNTRACPDPSQTLYFFELVLRVDSSVVIYNYDEIVFSNSGLLGERTIAIVPRPTPPGKPCAQEITFDTLYAKSADPINDALAKLMNVSDSVENTLVSISTFVTENKETAHRALISFADAADEIKSFVSQANEKDLPTKIAQATQHVKEAMGGARAFFDDANNKDLVDRLAMAAYQLENASHSINMTTSALRNGEGTLGRLFCDDTFYFQLSGTLSRLNTFIHNLNSYGLLYQWNSKWKRAQSRREACLHTFCSPQEAANYVHEQVSEMTGALNAMSYSISPLGICEETSEDPLLAEQFRILLSKTEALREAIMLYEQCHLQN